MKEASSMSVTVRRFRERNAEAWDGLVDGSWNGTFLHKRRFLSYHGERFRDVSLLVEDTRGRLMGVFPRPSTPPKKTS